MSISLLFCRNCTHDMPEFLHELYQLQDEHPDELYIVDTECMAACDHQPAILLDLDYFPELEPDDMSGQVHALLRDVPPFTASRN